VYSSFTSGDATACDFPMCYTDEVSIAGYSSDTNDGEVGRRGFMAAFDDSLAV